MSALLYWRAMPLAEKKGMWSAYYPRPSYARLPLGGTGRSFALHASDAHRRADDDDRDGRPGARVLS